MKLHIFKNFHYSTFLPKIIKNVGGVTRSVKVKFNRSCMYTISEDSRVNKLWGFCNGLFGVHKDSWRFGWTYNTNKDKINIWSYIYNFGKLTKKRICVIDFDKEYELTLEVRKFDKTSYLVNFSVDNELMGQYYTSEFELKNYLLELGFYFGGNNRSPHKMILEFVRI